MSKEDIIVRSVRNKLDDCGTIIQVAELLKSNSHNLSITDVASMFLDKVEFMYLNNTPTDLEKSICHRLFEEIEDGRGIDLKAVKRRVNEKQITLNFSVITTVGHVYKDVVNELVKKVTEKTKSRKELEEILGEKLSKLKVK